MPERYRPLSKAGDDGSDVEGLVWSDDYYDGRYRVELQEGVIPYLGNLLVFDTDNHNEILLNEVVPWRGPAYLEDDAADWTEKALASVEASREEE